MDVWSTISAYDSIQIDRSAKQNANRVLLHLKAGQEQPPTLRVELLDSVPDSGSCT